MAPDAPLQGIRVLECSALGPAAITMPLVDLGAEVIKVEPPSGDYIREMTWPIVEGVSLMHLHVNRGKRSIVMDLRQPEDVATFKELAKKSDVVVEAMRPGGLARRGVGYGQLKELNPKLVFCTISGYGMTGPYRDLPAHGIAFDTWAGIVSPQVNEEGFAYLPEHASMGIHAGPLFGALGILAAVLRARPPARAPSSRSPSPTRPPPWTGTAARPGAPTSAPSPRSPATRPTTTSAAHRAPPAWSRASATRSTRPRTSASSS